MVYGVLWELIYTWVELSLVERCLIATLVIGSPAIYIFETIRYWRLLKQQDIVHLAPIRMKGQILTNMGPDGVTSILSSELFSIIAILQNILGEKPAPYLAPATRRDTGYFLVGLRVDAPIPVKIQEENILKVEEEIVLRVGAFNLPISSILNFMLAVLGALPVPFRTIYKKSLIQISMISIGDQTRIVLNRLRDRKLKYSRLSEHAANPQLEGTDQSPIIFTETKTTKTLGDLNNLIRDAAFMILQAHGSFAGRNWRSMRHLIDGLIMLDEYRRTGCNESKSQAQKNFQEAVAADPRNNPEAQYLHGVMSMVDRTAESMEEAIREFESALDKTENRQLRALLHTGLAYRNSQKAHALSKFNSEIIKEAKCHAMDAAYEWLGYLDKKGRAIHAPKQKTNNSETVTKEFKQLCELSFEQLEGMEGERIRKGLHPLIPYTFALMIIADREFELDPEKRKEQLIIAARLYRQAIDLEPDNGMFYNNLGWVLMRLAEWGVGELTVDLQLTKRHSPRNTALLSEEYLKRAIGLNPSNKLAHANLCLLYSIDWFRRQADESFSVRSEYHGLKAIQLDPSYINGYRDLSIGLLRYSKLEKAYLYYNEALKRAEDPDKYHEIINLMVSEVRQCQKLSQEDIDVWQKPNTRFDETHPVFDGKGCN